MIGIYKITSPSGRVYIGQAVCIEKRKKSYEKLKCKGQPRLHASLLKYGFTRHIFEVVEECSIGELNIRERYWQDNYNVLHEKGLNCKLTKTEDRSGRMAENIIKKRYVAVNQFKKDGTFIRKWSSIKEAGESLSIDRCDISTCCRERVKTAGGYIWRYGAINIGNVPGVSKRELGSRDCKLIAQKNNKPVLQYSIQGTFIKEWKSITQAAEGMNTSVANISTAIKTNRLRVGYFWKILTK